MHQKSHLSCIKAAAFWLVFQSIRIITANRNVVPQKATQPKYQPQVEQIFLTVALRIQKSQAHSAYTAAQFKA